MHPLYAPQCALSEQCLFTLFDLRRPGAERRLRRELAAWRGFARAERLLDGCVVLVILPGGAAR